MSLGLSIPHLVVLLGTYYIPSENYSSVVLIDSWIDGGLLLGLCLTFSWVGSSDP